MFWVFTLVGGGLVWNSLDSIAGFFVATDGMADAFALVCGLALVEIAGAGLVAGTKQLGPQAHALVQAQLQ